MARGLLAAPSSSGSSSCRARAHPSCRVGRKHTAELASEAEETTRTLLQQVEYQDIAREIEAEITMVSRERVHKMLLSHQISPNSPQAVWFGFISTPLGPLWPIGREASWLVGFIYPDPSLIGICGLPLLGSILYLQYCDCKPFHARTFCLVKACGVPFVIGAAVPPFPPFPFSTLPPFPLSTLPPFHRRLEFVSSHRRVSKGFDR